MKKMEENTGRINTNKLLKSWITDAYQNHGIEGAPRQTDLVEKYVKEKNKRRVEGEVPYDKTRGQPTVSKALKRLIHGKEISKTNKKTYIPYEEENHSVVVENKIYKTVLLEGKLYDAGSGVMLLPIKDGLIYVSQELFKEYFGNACYDILIYNKYLVFLFNGSKENRIKNMNQLRKIVRNILNKNAF